MSADNKAERDRIISKIQKCLALSKSSNSNEAAAALRQAQKLMEAYAITERELNGSQVVSVLVVTVEPPKRKWPMYMVLIVNTCCKAFGVQALSDIAWVNGKPRFAMRYFGPESRAQLAAYAHEVMFRQLWNQWREYAADRPWLANERGARQGFWVGWLQAVRAKVVAFGQVPADEQAAQTAEQNANALVLVAQVKQELAIIDQAITDFCGGKEPEQCNTVSMSIRGDSRAAGHEAGSKFSIHAPLSGTKSKQRLLGN